MTLDATARESNIWDSIKKYFVDNMTTHPVTFDKSLVAPNIRGRLVDRWYSVVMGAVEIGKMSDIILDIFICTRQDNEWFKSAQMKDTMFELLTDPTKTDSTRRIPFYQSSATEAWVLLGGILVADIQESPRMEGPDETKYKILHCRLRTASKV